MDVKWYALKSHVCLCVCVCVSSTQRGSSSSRSSSAHSPQPPIQLTATHKPTAGQPVAISAGSLSSALQSIQPPASYQPPASQPVAAVSARSLSSALQSIQPPASYQPTSSQPLAVSAGSQSSPISSSSRLAGNQPEDYCYLANTSAGVKSRLVRNKASVTSRQDDVVGNSRLTDKYAVLYNAGVSASVHLPDRVPLQANFMPRDPPVCTTMSAITTHVDERCHIFIHELNGLYLKTLFLKIFYCYDL